MLSAGALAGVLIWAKLRLVENIPRSAYAEPDRLLTEPDPQPDSPKPDDAGEGIGGEASENGD